MAFVIERLDRPDGGALRAHWRPAHLAWLRQAYAARLIIAGPLLAAASGPDAASIGWLFLMDFTDRAAAEAFCAADPYARAGLFQSTLIRPWRQSFPGEC